MSFTILFSAVEQITVLPAFLNPGPTLGIAGAVSLAGLACAGLVARSRRPRPLKDGLLLPEARMQLAETLPVSSARRRAVAALLASVPPVAAAGSGITLNGAKLAVLRHVLARWGMPPVEDLTDAQVMDLYMLDQVLGSEPEEAGPLALHFRSPSDVLALRDRVAEMVARPGTA